MFAGVREIKELATEADSRVAYPPIWYILLKLNPINELHGSGGVSLHQEYR